MTSRSLRNGFSSEKRLPEVWETVFQAKKDFPKSGKRFFKRKKKLPVGRNDFLNEKKNLPSMDAAIVIYQKNGKFSVGEEGFAMLHAMADDRAAEGFGLFGRKDAPQFSC